MDRYISEKQVRWRGELENKILVITDFPTVEDETLGILLSGEPGMKLEQALPVPISHCLIVSLCQYHPADNNFAYIDGTDKLQAGIKAIKDYIDVFRPSLIIALGDQPLRYFANQYSIYNWRGSPLSYKGIPLLATHNPKEVIPYAQLYPIFCFDIQKAFKYMEGKQRIYNDQFIIVSDPLEMMNYVPEIIRVSNEKFVTCDIENRRSDSGLLCVGFGLSAERAICFVTSSESSINILRELFSKIGKVVWHNGSCWDLLHLRYIMNIPVPPMYLDTMVAQHVLELELPKGLDFLCSVHTWRACYWGDIKFDEDSKAWGDKISKSDSIYVYNCKDCVVTYESAEQQIADGIFKNPIFLHEMDRAEAFTHISKTGFLVDIERRQYLLDIYKKKWEYDLTTLLALRKGEPINISSPKQVQTLLYSDLALPERRNRKGKVTTDHDALVSLISFCKDKIQGLKTDGAKSVWQIKLAIVMIVLKIKGYEKMMSSYLENAISGDNRMRSIYKGTGTETGRGSASKWKFDDTGANGQTFPREELEVEE